MNGIPPAFWTWLKALLFEAHFTELNSAIHVPGHDHLNMKTAPLLACDNIYCACINLIFFPHQAVDTLLCELCKCLDEDMLDLDEYEQGLWNPDTQGWVERCQTGAVVPGSYIDPAQHPFQIKGENCFIMIRNKSNLIKFFQSWNSFVYISFG